MEAEICFRAKNFHNGGILLFTVILRQKRAFLVHLPSEFCYFFFFPTYKGLQKLIHTHILKTLSLHWKRCI